MNTKRNSLTAPLINIGITLIITVILATSQVIAQSSDTSSATAIQWSPSGNRLAVGKPDGTVHIQDGVTGQLVYILVGHTGRIADLGWSADEDKLVSASKDKTVRVWNTNSGQLLKTIVAPKDAIKTVIWGADPNNVIGIDSAEISDLFVWDVITGDPLQQFPEGTVSQIVRSPDGTRLALANPGGDVDLRDGNTLDFIAYWQQPEMTGRGFDVYQVTWSPDNSRLATGSLNGTVRVWNAGTSNPRGEILLTLQANDSQEIGPTTTMVRALAFTSNGSLLSSLSADGTIRVWNAISGQALNSTQVPVPVYAAAFSPDGSKLAYGDASGAVQIIPTPLCDFTIAAGDVAGLKAAITTANADPDTICLAAGSTYTLTTVDNTSDGPNGLPPITSPVTILGNGATLTRDPAAPYFRLLKVDAGASLTLENLTLSHGFAEGTGTTG